MSGCLEQTCRAALVPVQKQLHSVDSVREAVANSRQHKYAALAEARTPVRAQRSAQIAWRSFLVKAL